jgi:hypothetical protein
VVNVGQQRADAGTRGRVLVGVVGSGHGRILTSARGHNDTAALHHDRGTLDSGNQHSKAVLLGKERDGYRSVLDRVFGRGATRTAFT